MMKGSVRPRAIRGDRANGVTQGVPLRFASLVAFAWDSITGQAARPNQQ